MTRLVKVLTMFLLAGMLTSASNHSPSWVIKLHQSYGNVAEEFVCHWQDSEAMTNYERTYGLDQELILAKMWTETHGGWTGAGRKGALFGIKGKGIKGHDAKEKKMSNKGKVEYESYGAAWESISHFCQFVKKPLYAKRFEAWKQIYYDMPDWYNYALALQIHPERSKSRLAYASCGCEAKPGKIITRSCYEKRKAHAMKNITWILKYLRR